MDIAELTATSYPPGHNFWPGSPASWWFRGTLAFLLVAGPQLLASALAIRLCRRRREASYCVAAAALTFTVWLAWPAVLGLNFRDGDKPFYRGLTWGDDARLWILGAGIAASILATFVRARQPPGFPVIARQRS